MENLQQYIIIYISGQEAVSQARPVFLAGDSAPQAEPLAEAQKNYQVIISLRSDGLPSAKNLINNHLLSLPHLQTQYLTYKN